MSKENLNDFYNLNRFNQKLRERVDSYEPELSDSLWDRIEHGLERKESRSRRALWMVYVLGGLLLLSSGGLYYLWNQNQKLAADNRQSKEALLNSQVPSGRENSKGETAGELEEPVPVYVAPEAKVVHTPSASTPDPDQAPAFVATPSEPGAAAQSTSGNFTAPGISNPVSPAPEIIPAVVAVENNIPAVVSVPAKEFTLSHRLQNKQPGFLNLALKADKDIYPKVMPFVGVSSELGSTQQRLSGPYAASYTFEHAMLYHAQMLRFGVLTRSGWSFSSGVGTSTSGATITYGLVDAEKADTIPVLDEADSLVAGSNRSGMKQYWVDIPVQVQYQYSLNSKWSLTGNAGVTYSIINSYSGSEPERYFKALVPYGTLESQPFRNYFSVQVGTGIAYQLARNWQISLEGKYRRAVTDINRVHSLPYPNRRPEFLGAQFGLRYVFR